MTATSPTIAHLHAAPVHQGLRFSPWRHYFAVVLALVLWVLLSSTSHAGTCKSRTIKNNTVPAETYTVDATPIEEVITSHKASVVWTGCNTNDHDPIEHAGPWIGYFSKFGLALNLDPLKEPYIWSYTLDGIKVYSSGPVNTAQKRFSYNINCQSAPYDYCFDSKGKTLTLVRGSERHDSGLKMYIDLTISGLDKDKKGCMEVTTGSTGGSPVGGVLNGETAHATRTKVTLRDCITVQMDFTLSIVKTKPFSTLGMSDVTTIHLTRGNHFKYLFCNPDDNYCAGKSFILGGPFDLFNSGKPLTIKLSKTVRPLPPTKKCVVQLQSAPTRSRL